MELQSLTSDRPNKATTTATASRSMNHHEHPENDCDGADRYSSMPSPEDEYDAYDNITQRQRRRSVLYRSLGVQILIPAVALVVVAAMLLWVPSSHWRNGHQRKRLQFRVSNDNNYNNYNSNNNNQQRQQQQTFKILQLADLHIGEAEYTDWGPQQDVKTYQALQSIITSENATSPIDLIVLSGDQLTANDMIDNATVYYRQLCDHLVQYGIPWAMIFGNHDDQMSTRTGTSKYSRLDLFHVDHQYAPFSLTQRGPSNIFGVSNYILDVHVPNDGTTTNKNDDTELVALQILFLDSGGGLLPLQVEQSQMDWFLEKQQTGTPVVAFQHIPTVEFRRRSDDSSAAAENCQGLYEDGVANVTHDAGMVSTLDQLGHVHFLAVGHNHGNDYCCRYSPPPSSGSGSGNSNTPLLHVCFGRHSGYGGYGTWDRGARVYELTLASSSSSSSSLTWKSWVRMESGEIMDEYDPSVDYEDGDEG